MTEEQNFELLVKKALHLPDAATASEAVAEIQILVQYGRDLQATQQAVRELWQQLHNTFRGLKCSLNGSWTQAFEEIAKEIQLLQDANVRLNNARLTPITERTALIESIPGLAKRVEILEALILSQKPVEDSRAQS